MTIEGVSTFATPEGTFVKIEPSAIRALTAEAMHDIAHFLRPGHLQQLRNILDDPEASDNDRFVALDLLKNAAISAGGVLPMCQDTGTAIVKGKKGQFVFTGGGDERAIAQGIQDTYTNTNLRYSQMAPLNMYDEKNTGTNLPAEIKIAATDGDAYKFLFIAKGGGSANKSYLFQETKALLNEATLLPWIFEKIQTLGTAACPPYHLADRDRWHVGGVRARDRQAGVHPIPRLVADQWLAARARLPRHRARGAGAATRADHRHRRAVRRQVLLPRRAHRPSAAARRELSDRDRGVVFRRPPGTRQDHRRGRVPRGARARSGPVPARHHRVRPRRCRRGPHRSQPADERHPRRAVEVPRADTA